MSRLQAWRESKEKKRRRRRLIGVVGMIFMGSALFHLCSDPELQSSLTEIKSVPEIRAPSQAVEKKAGPGPIARQAWKHRSRSAENLLAAVSQAIATTPAHCRLQRSVRWEFSLDTLSGRVFDFRFQDLESGQNLMGAASSCLEEQWLSYRYTGPERYQSEPIRLSFIFQAVDGQP